MVRVVSSRWFHNQENREQSNDSGICHYPNFLGIVRLSASGLTNAPFAQLEADCRLIAGGVRYPFPRVVADFVSPRVAQLHRTDATADSYTLESADPETLFPDVLALGFGHDVAVTATNRTFLRALAEDLGNSELAELVGDPGSGSVTADNVIGRIPRKGRLGLSATAEADWLARNLCDVPVLEQLGVDDSHGILSRECLTLVDENWLARFVIARMDGDAACFGLFGLVRFEYLSAERGIRRGGARERGNGGRGGPAGAGPALGAAR